MANINANNYKKAAAFTPASESVIGRGLWGGAIRAQVDSYKTGTNTLQPTNTIAVAKIPAGATIVGGHIIADRIQQANATLSVGWGADANQLLTATNVNAANVDKNLKLETRGVPTDQFTSDTEIVIKYAADANANANAEIKTCIEYVLD